MDAGLKIKELAITMLYTFFGSYRERGLLGRRMKQLAFKSYDASY